MPRYKLGRDGPTYSPLAAASESFLPVPWAETLLNGSADSMNQPATASAVTPVSSSAGGYCPACFKNFRSDFRSLDENGNCKIHGGQFGQNFNMSKTKQRIAGVGILGAAALLLLAAKNRK